MPAVLFLTRQKRLTVKTSLKKEFKHGLHDGIPIGLGYFAVAFTLGIAAGNAGMTWFQSGLMSALMVASAGEFGAITVIAAEGTLIEMAVTTAIINMRYILMSCALGPKIDKERGFFHRFILAHFVTDELFAINMSHASRVIPEYYYGAILTSAPAWVVGTALGCAVGNVVPEWVGACLGISLYGMFIAIIVPPAKRDKTLLMVVLAAIALSTLFDTVPGLNSLSSGNRIIIITVVVAAAAALLKPVKEAEA